MTNNLPYWKSLRRRFLQKAAARWALRYILFLVFISIFGGFIANNKPVYCRLEGKNYFPVVREYAYYFGLAGFDTLFHNGQWKSYECDAVLPVLIPYKSTQTDLPNIYKSPFGEQQVESGYFRHYLGTHENGQDVAAGIIAGTRTALLVGLLSVLIAGILGVVLGSIAGFWGDDRLVVSRSRLILNILAGIAFVFFYFISPYLQDRFLPGHPFLSGSLIFLGLFLLFNLPAGLLKKIQFFRKAITLPADLLIMRLIEIKNAIPALLLLMIAVAWIRQPSVFYVIAIIGLLEWSVIARFLRGELLRVRSLEYIAAARSMGFQEWRILMRHALPNAITPVLVALSFGTAGAIVLEASISFMGIGNYTTVTWGNLLMQANAHRWWLAVFPGLAIFSTVLAFNTIGETIAELME